MAGLANALRMSVLERTREIGILCSIRGRAQDIRRIFATESLTVAAADWRIGVPLGYLLGWFLVWLVKTVIKVAITFAFPAWNLALALAGAVLLVFLIAFVPIRRAAHLGPGDALRYVWETHTLGCAHRFLVVPASSQPCAELVLRPRRWGRLAFSPGGAGRRIRLCGGARLQLMGRGSACR